MRRILLTVLLLMTTAAASCDTPTAPNGGIRTRWFQPQTGYGHPGPAIAGDLVYFATGAGELIARDRLTGEAAWTTKIADGDIDGSNILVIDGVVVVPVTSYTAGVDARTGQLRWTYGAPHDTIDQEFPGPGYVGVSRIDSAGPIAYIPAWGASVSAVDVRTGVAQWTWRVESTLPYRSGSNGVTVSGDTVFATVWHYLTRFGLVAEAWVIALDRLTGRELWRVVLPERSQAVMIECKPLIWNNLVIVNDISGRVYAIDRTNRTIVWQVEPQPADAGYLRNAVISGPASYQGEDVVYHDGGNLYLYARRASDGALLWRAPCCQANDDLLVTARHIYANEDAHLLVYDRITGEQVERLRPPRHADNIFVSTPAYADGQLFITLNNAAFSFDEPQ